MPVGVLFLCLHVGGICAHGGENARSGFGFFLLVLSGGKVVGIA